MWKRILKGLALVLLLGVLGASAIACEKVRAFDASMSHVYDVPVSTLVRSSDPAVIARGGHLAASLGECVLCHGENLAGGRVEPMGPLGRIVIPNITTGRDGRGSRYSDGELARLVQHGIRRDGTSVRLMPSQNTAWWSDEDVVALISWIRARPPVDGDPGVVELSPFAKVLDRIDSIPIDVARRIEHAAVRRPPPPAPDARYGELVGTACRGCHGPTLSGGPIPGAPPGLAVPLNLTPHESGLAAWTFEDFEAFGRTGRRKDGRVVDPFMPVQPLANLDDVERRALWAYLRSVPPRAFGGR
jgi:mono/diheme cytochrome c family protein